MKVMMIITIAFAFSALLTAPPKLWYFLKLSLRRKFLYELPCWRVQAHFANFLRCLCGDDNYSVARYLYRIVPFVAKANLSVAQLRLRSSVGRVFEGNFVFVVRGPGVRKDCVRRNIFLCEEILDQVKLAILQYNNHMVQGEWGKEAGSWTRLRRKPEREWM